MGYVKNLMMEAEGYDREQDRRKNSKTNNDSSVLQILLDNGFDEEAASRIASDLSRNGVDQAREVAMQMVP